MAGSGPEKCPKCERRLEGEAGVCPHCGARFARFGPLEAPSIWVRLWAGVWLMGGLLLALAGGACSIGILAEPGVTHDPYAVIFLAVTAPSCAVGVAASRLAIRSVRRRRRRHP